MNKKFLALVLTSCLAGYLHAQDPHFSQFYANPLYLNPAFAGSNGCSRANVIGRYQWPQLSGDYRTISASYDANIASIRGGLGLMILHDAAGQNTIATTRISGIYSYELPVNENFTLRMAAEATYNNIRIDKDKLYFGDQIHPRYGFIYPTSEVINNPSRGFLDIQAGILGYTDKLFFGFAVHHLTEPQQNFIPGPASKLPRKYTGHIGAIIPIGNTSYMVNERRDMISPNLMFKMQGQSMQINVGLYAQKGAIVGGLWYRNVSQDFASDAMIAMIGMYLDKFKIGYSYDFTISKLTNATSSGAHELSLGMNFNCVERGQSFRMLDCPAF